MRSCHAAQEALLNVDPGIQRLVHAGQLRLIRWATQPYYEAPSVVKPQVGLTGSTHPYLRTHQPPTHPRRCILPILWHCVRYDKYDSCS